MADINRDREFYMTLVTFKVKDAHFRVPVEAFQTCSEVFRDMFALPQTAESPEGNSDDSPIVLEGIKVDDFRALLRYLYPKKRGEKLDFSQKEWIGIHTLAHMWGFQDASKASKEFLIDMDDSITKLEIGTRYKYDDWRRKAFGELARRPACPSPDEAKRICIREVFNIFRLREVRLEAQSSFKVLHPAARVSAYATNAFGKTPTYHCPHCSTLLQVEHSTGTPRPKPAYKCGPCAITFYEDKSTVDKCVSGWVEEAISLVLRHDLSSPSEIQRTMVVNGRTSNRA